MTVSPSRFPRSCTLPSASSCTASRRTRERSPRRRLALSPSLLTTYAFGLASAFSDFYEHTPAIVREEDAGVRRFRRALVAATRATLADALHTLGMAAPDQV